MVLSARMSEPADDPDQIRQCLDKAAGIAGIRLPSDLNFDSERDHVEQHDLLAALYDYRETFRKQVWNVVTTFTASASEPARAASEKKQKSREADRFARISKNALALHHELHHWDLLEALHETMENIGETVGAPTTGGELDSFVEDLKLLGLAAQDSELRARAESRKKRGRPRQSAIDHYVLGLALIYSVYSKKPFTFQRFKNSEGIHQAITPGHQFVSCIVEGMMREPDEHPLWRISESALVTACERAVTRLRKFPK